MLNKIIQYSLHNRLLVMIAAVALLIWGSITAHNMEVDVFPDLNAPTVVVMTEAQGMAPEEVERLVTFPVETAVNGATDVRRVRSSSTTGFSVVWVGRRPAGPAGPGMDDGADEVIRSTEVDHVMK